MERITGWVWDWMVGGGRRARKERKVHGEQGVEEMRKRARRVWAPRNKYGQAHQGVSGVRDGARRARK
eukprot:5004028-Prorocentrum_lima.AAC.1